MRIPAIAHGLWMAQVHVSTTIIHRPMYIIITAPFLINSWPRQVLQQRLFQCVVCAVLLSRPCRARHPAPGFYLLTSSPSLILSTLTLGTGDRTIQWETHIYKYIKKYLYNT